MKNILGNKTVQIFIALLIIFTFHIQVFTHIALAHSFGGGNFAKDTFSPVDFSSPKSLKGSLFFGTKIFQKGITATMPNMRIDNLILKSHIKW